MAAAAANRELAECHRWRREFGSSPSGTTLTLADIPSLRSHASAALQTSDIARRLMRGGELHQEEGASSGPDLIAIFRAFSSISLPFVSSIQAL
jgi:hypothetical protein